MRKFVLGVAVVAIAISVAGSGSAYGKATSAPPGKTFMCHITGEDIRGDGEPRWTGKVLLVSDNAVAAHCSHRVGDHNPLPQNERIGNFCSRPKFIVNPICQVGGQ